MRQPGKADLRVKINMPWVPQRTRERWERDIWRVQQGHTRTPSGKMVYASRAPDIATLETVTPDRVYEVIAGMNDHCKARQILIGDALGLCKPRPGPRYLMWRSAWYANAVHQAILLLRKQGRIVAHRRGYLPVRGFRVTGEVAIGSSSGRTA